MPQALEHSERLRPEVDETRRRNLLHFELRNLYGQTVDLHAVYCLTKLCKKHRLAVMLIFADVGCVADSTTRRMIGAESAAAGPKCHAATWGSLQTWSTRRKSRLMTLGMKQCT